MYDLNIFWQWSCFCGWWPECDIYVGSHRSGQSERSHPLSVAINSNYCSTLSKKRGDTSATTLLLYFFYFLNRALSWSKYYWFVVHLLSYWTPLIWNGYTLLKTIPPENCPESQFGTRNHFHWRFYSGPTKNFFLARCSLRWSCYHWRFYPTKLLPASSINSGSSVISSRPVVLAWKMSHSVPTKICLGSRWGAISRKL